MGSTKNSRNIKASIETIYRAFTNPESLAIWLAPNNMTGKIHHFDLRVGGGYQMSLLYLTGKIKKAVKLPVMRIDLPQGLLN